MSLLARANRIQVSSRDVVGLTMQIRPPGVRISCSAPRRNTSPGPETWAIAPSKPIMARCSIGEPGFIRPRMSPGLTVRPAI